MIDLKNKQVLFVGDPHLKINMLDQVRLLLKWIGEVAEKRKPDCVVVLGDAFDTHSIIRSEILGEFRDFVNHITDTLGIPMVYILGNHDFYRPDNSKYHALQTLDNIDNFYIIDKITHIDGFTLVPYLPNDEDFPMECESIVIAHQTFVGADYGFKKEDEGVLADNVKCDLIISGHIHKKQAYGKVIYPGTPYAFNLNDIDQRKGIMMFDTATWHQEFIESPFPQWKSIAYTLDTVNTTAALHSILVSDLNDRDRWVVKLEGPKAEINSYLEDKKFTELRKRFDIRVDPTYTDNDKKKIEIKAISMNDIVKEYVDKVYVGGVNKEALSGKALEILEKVKQST